MMRRLVRTAGRVALAILPLACADGARTHVVDVRGFVFLPGTLEIAAGDTLLFVNHDMVPHTATSADASWDTGPLATGDSARVVPDSTGGYFCAFHPNMTARVTVAR